MGLADRVEQHTLGPLLDALDRTRSWLLKRGAGLVRYLVRDRNRRVVAVAAISCATALVAAALAPGYQLLLGPLVFGVPHLFFEARYLFFQRRYRRPAWLIALLVAQAAFVFAGSGIYTLGLTAAIVVASEGRLRDRNCYLLLLLAGLTQAAAMIGPTWSRFVLLHAHNCLPLALWLAWRKRPASVSFAVTVFVCAGAWSILGGGCDGLPIRTPLTDGVFSITRITDAVAGGLDGVWRHRLLRWFCFMQAVHYAIWLRLIPEEARSRATPRSFRASWRAFQRDAGALVARLMVLATVGMTALPILLGAVRARSYYVRLSEFHATVELLLVAVLFAHAGP